MRFWSCPLFFSESVPQAPALTPPLARAIPGNCLRVSLSRPHLRFPVSLRTTSATILPRACALRCLQSLASLALSRHASPSATHFRCCGGFPVFSPWRLLDLPRRLAAWISPPSSVQHTLCLPPSHPMSVAVLAGLPWALWRREERWKAFGSRALAKPGLGSTHLQIVSLPRQKGWGSRRTRSVPAAPALCAVWGVSVQASTSVCSTST